MTYKLQLLAYTPLSGETRKIVTNIAGCANEEDAIAKAKNLYFVSKVLKIEPAKEK